MHLRYSSGSAFRKTASPHALKHALYTDGLLIKSSCSGKLHSMESVSEYSAYLATAQGQLAFYSTCPACVPRCGCSHSPQTPKAVWQSHGLVNLGVAPQPVFLLACGLGSRAHEKFIESLRQVGMDTGARSLPTVAFPGRAASHSQAARDPTHRPSRLKI